MLPVRKFRNDDDFFRFPEPFFRGFDFMPLKTDVKDLGDNIEMEIDFPGFAKEDIDISLKDGYLHIEGVRNIDKEEKDEKGNYLRRERFSGKTSRNYYVGDVSEKDIKASFENGVLKVTIPKEKESLPEAKKIAIK